MPICHRTESDRPTVNLKYPRQLDTLGDHIRSRRLNLGLFQKDVASQVGISTDTIILWESNAATPQIHHYPKIIEFLGYDPLPAPQNLAASLFVARKAHGWSRRQAAKVAGLDEGTLARLERGRCRRPTQKTLKKLAALMQRGS